METGNFSAESYDIENEIGQINFKFFENSSTLSFFPNPVYDLGKLVWKNKQNTPIKYWLTNLSGKVLMDMKIGAPNQNIIEIDFSNLETGIYFLSVENSINEISNYKIIKIN